jgi:hypothetical protein
MFDRLERRALLGRVRQRRQWNDLYDLFQIFYLMDLWEILEQAWSGHHTTNVAFFRLACEAGEGLR